MRWLIGAMLRHLAFLLLEWSQRFHTRREIARLDERDMCDLGQRSIEAEKPFWRP